MTRGDGRREWRVRALIAACATLAALAAPALATPGLSRAATGPVGGAPVYSITYAARVCSQYTDVMANKARNNLMESLRDLGPDTTYSPSASVTAAAEAAGSPLCQPLTDWRFTLGQNIQAKSPATLELSTVTGAYATNIVTGSSTPLLDAQGQPTGQNLVGAVTVPLDAAQLARIQSGQKIWVQGGTPAAPLNGQQTTYGYAALRCSYDVLNGDNVEFVGFRSGETHVFCFYYAVTPPPDPGTIIVRKQLAAGTNGGDTFTFTGNLSYADSNNDGTNDFSLTATSGQPGSQTFIRGAVGAGDPAWTVEEQPSNGWQPPPQPLCESAGGSTFVYSGAQVAITLAALDTVTCTYTNARIPTGASVLRKEISGGVGTFPIRVEVPGPGGPIDTSVTTAEEGVPVDVVGTAGSEPGPCTATETLPAPTAAGSWELAEAQCNGVQLAVTANGLQRSATYTIASGAVAECLLSNAYTPDGSLTIRKTSQAGVGRFQYDIVSLTNPDLVAAGASFPAVAVTTSPGQTVTAVPSYTGIDVLKNSLLAIQETLPANTSSGFWRMVGADCGPNDSVVSAPNAFVVVRLTETNPDAVCSFSNEFVAAGTLDVVKNTSADPAQRGSDAAITVTCDDGTDQSFGVAPGASTGALAQLGVFETAQCSVTETASGASTGWSATASARISTNGGPAQPLDLRTGAFTIAPATAVVVTIDNSFVADPGGDTGAGTGGSTIAATGLAYDPWPVGGLAAALVLGGLAMRVPIGSRRRRP
jgi:hypothetical protein